MGCEEKIGSGGIIVTTDSPCLKLPTWEERIECLRPGDWPTKGNAKVLVGPLVEGLRYSYHTYGKIHASGVTDENGFLPKQRGKLLLSVGDITLTESAVWVGIVEYPIISPMSLDDGLLKSKHPENSNLAKTEIEPSWINSLSTDRASVNRARFIQSLDDDNDVSNGIQILPKAHTSAQKLSVDFDVPTEQFEQSVASYFEILKRPLIGTEEALANLEDGLVGIFAQRYFAYSEYTPIEITGPIFAPRGKRIGLGLTTQQVRDKCIKSSIKFSYDEFDENTPGEEITLCFPSDKPATLSMLGQDYEIKRYGINKIALFVVEVAKKDGGNWHTLILTLPDGNYSYKIIGTPGGS